MTTTKILGDDEMNATIRITARAKAFGDEGVREHKCLVDLADGSVRVWDSVAGHYTACNSLSEAASKRIVRSAKEVAKGQIAR